MVNFSMDSYELLLKMGYYQPSYSGYSSVSKCIEYASTMAIFFGSTITPATNRSVLSSAGEAYGVALHWIACLTEPVLCSVSITDVSPRGIVES